jgi:hypothetical protein
MLRFLLSDTIGPLTPDALVVGPTVPDAVARQIHVFFQVVENQAVVHLRKMGPQYSRERLLALERCSGC